MIYQLIICDDTDAAIFGGSISVENFSNEDDLNLVMNIKVKKAERWFGRYYTEVREDGFFVTGSDSPDDPTDYRCINSLCGKVWFHVNKI